MSVTISPNAPYHSMYFGAFIRAPVSIMSKIQNQIERRDDHDEKAEADPDPTRSVDGRHCYVKEAENHLGEIEDGDAAGRRDHAQPEALRRANYACLVSQQHDEQYAKGQANGLEGDARIRLFKDGGNSAKDKARA